MAPSSSCSATGRSSTGRGAQTTEPSLGHGCGGQAVVLGSSMSIEANLRGAERWRKALAGALGPATPTGRGPGSYLGLHPPGQAGPRTAAGSWPGWSSDRRRRRVGFQGRGWDAPPDHPLDRRNCWVSFEEALPSRCGRQRIAARRTCVGTWAPPTFCPHRKGLNFYGPSTRPLPIGAAATDGGAAWLRLSQAGWGAVVAGNTVGDGGCTGETKCATSTLGSSLRDGSHPRTPSLACAEQWRAEQT